MSTRPRDFGQGQADAPRSGSVLVRDAKLGGVSQVALIEFELYEALAPGGQAEAYPRWWDNDQDDYVTDTDADTFTVVDVLKRFRGRGRDYTDPDNEVDGSRGVALLRHGRLEIQHLNCHATRITCFVDESSGFSEDANWIAVDNVVVAEPVKTALLMSDVTQIYNKHSWAGVDNQPLQAVWNDAEQHWETAMKNCGGS